LWWILSNQGMLRVDVYQGLVDTIGDDANDEIDLRNLGRHVILPSSFFGSTRMLEIFKILWQLFTISNVQTYLEE